MKLLERQNLIDRLQALLADARRGKGRVVALSGEAGVGKTALVRTFADLADDKVRVLWGACEDLATPEPLGPLQEIARAAGWDIESAIARGWAACRLLGSAQRFRPGGLYLPPGDRGSALG